MEFTGTYERCNSCGYVWDFMESNCPECGSQEIEGDLNAQEIKDSYKNVKGTEFTRMARMLELHGD